MPDDRAPATGRRAFLKTACFGGVCACAGASEVGATPAPSVRAGGDAADSSDLPRMWIAALLPALTAVDAAETRDALKGCAASHFEALGMAPTLARLRGDLPALLDFLRSEWGWIVEHDAASGVIHVNENKDHCVCPLVPAEPTDDLGALCSCSEGFAERMFVAVVGHPVRAQVVESILRGGTRCRYRLDLAAGER